MKLALAMIAETFVERKPFNWASSLWIPAKQDGQAVGTEVEDVSLGLVLVILSVTLLALVVILVHVILVSVVFEETEVVTEAVGIIEPLEIIEENIPLVGRMVELFALTLERIDDT